MWNRRTLTVLALASAACDSFSTEPAGAPDASANADAAGVCRLGDSFDWALTAPTLPNNWVAKKDPGAALAVEAGELRCSVPLVSPGVGGDARLSRLASLPQPLPESIVVRFRMKVVSAPSPSNGSMVAFSVDEESAGLLLKPLGGDRFGAFFYQSPQQQPTFSLSVGEWHAFELVYRPGAATLLTVDGVAATSPITPPAFASFYLGIRRAQGAWVVHFDDYCASF